MASILNTPILFLVFNRPAVTQRVFSAIQQARPKSLYMAADGPRPDKEGEKEKCEATRAIIKQVDWDCEVKTLFRDENLGCGRAVSSGINWFFDNVEEGIILEDDCVPSTSFFHFASAMLEKFRQDNRIMMITGTNFLGTYCTKKPAPFLSKYFSIWGWATWRRAWNFYDRQIEGYTYQNGERMLRRVATFKPFILTLNNLLQDVKQKRLDTWCVQWYYACLKNNGFCIVPPVNLISNVGVDGCHSSRRDRTHEIRSYDCESKIEISFLEPRYSSEYDRKAAKQIYGRTHLELLRAIITRLQRLISTEGSAK